MDISRRKFLATVGASAAALGVVINRINVFLTAFQPPYGTTPYFPSVIEIAVTAGLISALVLVYRTLVRIFPVITVNGVEHPMKMTTSSDQSMRVVG